MALVIAQCVAMLDMNVRNENGKYIRRYGQLSLDTIISNNTIFSLCFSAGGRALHCIEQSSIFRESRFFNVEL